LLSILAIVVAVPIWLTRLDGRVQHLEEQVHTLTVAPVIAATSGQSSRVLPNPIAEACADLARQGVKPESPKIRDWDVFGPTSRDEAERMMQALGCVSTQKARADSPSFATFSLPRKQ